MRTTGLIATATSMRESELLGLHSPSCGSSGLHFFFGSLLFLYKVPQIAKRKIEKAQRRTFIRFCIANARKHDTTLISAITEDCTLDGLSEDCLRALLCAANSVSIDFKPVIYFAVPLNHLKRHHPRHSTA